MKTETRMITNISRFEIEVTNLIKKRNITLSKYYCWRVYVEWLFTITKTTATAKVEARATKATAFYQLNSSSIERELTVVEPQLITIINADLSFGDIIQPNIAEVDIDNKTIKIEF
jgi:hypothetical protein